MNSLRGGHIRADDALSVGGHRCELGKRMKLLLQDWLSDILNYRGRVLMLNPSHLLFGVMVLILFQINLTRSIGIRNPIHFQFCQPNVLCGPTGCCNHNT